MLLECRRHPKLSQESTFCPVCLWLLAFKCRSHALWSLVVLLTVCPPSWLQILPFHSLLSLQVVMTRPVPHWYTVFSVATHLEYLHLGPLGLNCSPTTHSFTFYMAYMVDHRVEGWTASYSCYHTPPKGSVDGEGVAAVWAVSQEDINHLCTLVWNSHRWTCLVHAQTFVKPHNASSESDLGLDSF